MVGAKGIRPAHKFSWFLNIAVNSHEFMKNYEAAYFFSFQGWILDS